MVHARQLLFRLFYSTTFTLVFLLLIAFICVSPADTLYESYKRKRLIDIFMISGAYVVTALIAALIYASRLYTTRSILKDIPKTFIPLDKEELPGKRTWRLIRDTVKRSAVVGYLARPRARRVERGDFDEELQRRHDNDEHPGEKVNVKERIRVFVRPQERRHEQDEADDMAVIMDMDQRWGTISHAGWSSPADTRMPNLEYRTVVAELTDLVEAKAVSLAPLVVDPAAAAATTTTPVTVDDKAKDDEDADQQPSPPDDDLVPDVRVVEVLTRPETAGMRQYIAQLIDLEVLSSDTLTTTFLTLYERARFSPEPLSETEFASLTRMFAALLREMKPANLHGLETEGSRAEDDVDVDETPPPSKHLGNSDETTTQQDPGDTTPPPAPSARHVDVDVDADTRSLAKSVSSSRSSKSSLASSASISGSVRHMRGGPALPAFRAAPPRSRGQDRDLMSGLDAGG